MSNPQKSAGVKAVRDELYKWEELRRAIEDPSIDFDFVIDTLEGETELYEALLMISEEIAEREAMQDAVAARIKEMTARKSRIESGTETLRAIILQAMDRAGVKKIPGELCTISMRDVAPKLIIGDESKIPSKFFIPQDPKLDKKALTDAAKDGPIDGTTMGNGGISLTIRRK